VSGCGDDHKEAFSRIEYRRFVAWSRRIEREAPVLLSVLNSGPTNRVLDLGCGTGEHSRFLAEHGFQVTGIDRSEALIAEARTSHPVAGARFVVGDLRELTDIVELGENSYGGAICLGNTAANLLEEADLERFLAGLARCLSPGSPVILQMLNYAKLRKQSARYLPLNFAEDAGRWRIFLRLMEFSDDRYMVFVPGTLQLDYAADPPLQVVQAQTVRLRTWTREETVDAMRNAGFVVEKVLGSFDGTLYEPDVSGDLIIVGRRQGTVE